MGVVKAAFLVTVYADDDDYAGFTSPARIDWSHAEVQSWLSQNYLERIHDAMELQDRPATLSWTVDTVVEPIVDEVEDLVSKHWALSDHIYGDDGFREFARQQEQDAIDHARKVRDARHRAEARGYRDFL